MDEPQKSNTQEKKKDEAKDRPEIPKPPSVDNFPYFLAGLFRDVLTGQKQMVMAERMLLEYVEDLSADEQAAWKAKALDLSRRTTAVAEGLASAMVVANSRM